MKDIFSIKFDESKNQIDVSIEFESNEELAVLGKSIREILSRDEIVGMYIMAGVSAHIENSMIATNAELSLINDVFGRFFEKAKMKKKKK